MLFLSLISYRSGSAQAEISLKRYKYVYKELDNETGLYNYGMRYYAPHIARFVSVDPLQFDYPIYTPFQYAGNKPISNIDLDGLEDKNVTKGKDPEEVKGRQFSTRWTVTTATYDLGINEAGVPVFLIENGVSENRLFISNTKYDFKTETFTYSRKDLNNDGKIDTEDYLKINDGSFIKLFETLEIKKSQSEKASNHYFYSTYDNHDPFNTFVFLAKHTYVEWHLSGFEEDDKIKYYLMTSLSEKSVSSYHLFDHLMLKLEKEIFAMHNHPNGNVMPSGSRLGTYSDFGSLYSKTEQLKDIKPPSRHFIYIKEGSISEYFNTYKYQILDSNIKSGNELSKIINSRR